MGINTLYEQNIENTKPDKTTSLLRWILKACLWCPPPASPHAKSSTSFTVVTSLFYLLEYYPYFSFPSVFSRGLITGFIVFNGGSHFQLQHRLDLPTQQTNNQHEVSHRPRTRSRVVHTCTCLRLVAARREAMRYGVPIRALPCSTFHVHRNHRLVRVGSGTNGRR